MNTNTEEWGNIELPGLSDEKLLNTNWNYVAANREKAKDKNILKKLSVSISNYWENLSIEERIELGKKQSQVQKELLEKNPELKKNHIKRNQNQIYDPKYKTALVKGIEKRDADPTYKNKMKEVYKKRDLNNDWKNNIKKAQQNRSPEHIKNSFRSNAYPIITPDGVFEGLNDAHQAYNKIKNFNNGRKWILGMMKKDPENYYKISWEEFDNLKKINSQ